MTLFFRRYTEQDRPACLSVFASNVPRYFREHEQADFESYIGDSGEPFFVIESSGSIVGCGGYAIPAEGTIADLCWGMIAQGHHGTRLGEYLLLGRLAAIVTEPGITGVRLGTCQLTQGFFQRYGFEIRHTQHDGIAAGLDEVEMFLAVTDETRTRILTGWRGHPAQAPGSQPDGLTETS